MKFLNISHPAKPQGKEKTFLIFAAALVASGWFLPPVIKAVKTSKAPKTPKQINPQKDTTSPTDIVTAHLEKLSRLPQEKVEEELGISGIMTNAAIEKVEGTGLKSTVQTKIYFGNSYKIRNFFLTRQNENEEWQLQELAELNITGEEAEKELLIYEDGNILFLHPPGWVVTTQKLENINQAWQLTHVESGYTAVFLAELGTPEHPFFTGLTDCAGGVVENCRETEREVRAYKTADYIGGDAKVIGFEEGPNAVAVLLEEGEDAPENLETEILQILDSIKIT